MTMRLSSTFAYLLLLAAFSATDAAPALLPQNAGGGQNGQVVAQLKSQFEKSDLDGNTFLDKDELAKAFRGPKAKPPTQGITTIKAISPECTTRHGRSIPR